MYYAADASGLIFSRYCIAMKMLCWPVTPAVRGCEGAEPLSAPEELQGQIKPGRHAKVPFTRHTTGCFAV